MPRLFLSSFSDIFWYGVRNYQSLKVLPFFTLYLVSYESWSWPLASKTFSAWHTSNGLSAPSVGVTDPLCLWGLKGPVSVTSVVSGSGPCAGYWSGWQLQNHMPHSDGSSSGAQGQCHGRAGSLCLWPLAELEADGQWVLAGAWELESAPSPTRNVWRITVHTNPLPSILEPEITLLTSLRYCITLPQSSSGGWKWISSISIN